MYLERKIDQYLLNWKNKDKKLPLLIIGLRQCGKTESVRHFAKNYENFVEINFGMILIFVPTLKGLLMLILLFQTSR